MQQGFAELAGVKIGLTLRNQRWKAEECMVGDMCREHCRHNPQPHLSRAGFLNVSTVDILDYVILCCEGRFGYCRIFSSIPYLYQLDASKSLPPGVMATKCALGGKIVPS